MTRRGSEAGPRSRAADGATIGVDIGGTFTDVVVVGADGRITGTKAPTTPDDLTHGILTATTRVLEESGVAPTQVTRFVHGTTVATNAILERKGSRIGLVTTKGFRDILAIGRLERRSLYDMFHEQETPTFLIERRSIVEVAERLSATGAVVAELDADELRKGIRKLRRSAEIDALAVCFLFAHRNGAHEERAGEVLAECAPDLSVSLSSAVNPVEREYERLCVTAFDAYVKPLVSAYLAHLIEQLAVIGLSCPVHIVRSRGVAGPVQHVIARPVETLLSGPAAGVRGAAEATKHLASDLLTFDMGGTSCDVALILNHEPRITGESEIAGYPLTIPMVDVKTIGAGGGSIAWLDTGGGLHVGPESAGASPGPACYGKGGTRPTVTDASVVLAYLTPELGSGDVRLDPELAHQAIGELASSAGLSVAEAALGIHRIVNEGMADLVRLVTVRAGRDPRRCSLVAFGGAGPLHAAAVAASLGIKSVLVPPAPGLLCAHGAVMAPVGVQRIAALRESVDAAGVQVLVATAAKLTTDLETELRSSGEATSSTTARCVAAVRYADQSHQIEIPVDLGLSGSQLAESLRSAFREEHVLSYGHARDDSTIEMTSMRVSVEFRPAAAAKRPVAAPDAVGKPRTVAAVFPGNDRAQVTPILARSTLRAADRLQGPLIVTQPDTTILVRPGDELHVRESDVLEILVGP